MTRTSRLRALWRLWQRRRALAWPVRECPASRLYATRLLLAKAERVDKRVTRHA